MKKLSIIVCCRNEEKTIMIILNKLFKLSMPNDWEKDIIIIDNCSTDNTRELLSKIDRKDTRVVYQKINQGKGNSVKLGIQYASGDFIIPQDSDLEYDPIDIPALLTSALENNYDFVIGTRKKSKSRFHKYFINEIGANFLTYFFNFLYSTNFSDIASCYKLMRATTIKKLNLYCDGFDLDYEIVSKLMKAKVKYNELPISYKSRSFEEGRRTVFMKNNIYFDGLKGLFIMIKIKLFN